VLVTMILRKYIKKRPMTNLGEIDDDSPELAKYKDQIEKDTANLD